jgi:hypothetical protein
MKWGARQIFDEWRLLWEPNRKRFPFQVAIVARQPA